MSNRSNNERIEVGKHGNEKCVDNIAAIRNSHLKLASDVIVYVWQDFVSDLIIYKWFSLFWDFEVSDENETKE